jgi:hypothetical protein
MAGLRTTLYCILGTGGLLFVWLFGARPFSLLVDRFHTVLIESPPLDHVRYDRGVLELGRMGLYAMLSKSGLPAEVTLGSGGRAILISCGHSFPLGPGHTALNGSGAAVIDLAPDPGDGVTVTVERSALSWPTPFEVNFMTGHSPSWKRSIYCRLRWVKRSGACLEMLWREEQNFYEDTGWVPRTIEASTSGLTRVSIAGAAGLEEAAVQYLRSTKHWERSEYRLEDRGPASDGAEEILVALHRDDERSSRPGAGRSVELRVDYESRRVTRETGYQ